ncbi:MAG: hypothetical protein H3C51_13065 [Rubellimicrobium sp.]|nr:hypothetical protein [Rubellimicrobium sp.]
MPSTPGFESRLFLSGSLAFLLIGTFGAANGVALPAFAARFALADWQAGLFLAAWGLGSVLAVLAGTMGLRGVTARLAAFMLLSGAALIASGAGWAVVVAGGLVAGAGFGVTASHVNRASLTGFGPRGPSMVSLVNAIAGLGSVAGPALLVAVSGSTLLLYAVLAALALASLVLHAPGDDAFAGAARGLPPLRRREIGLLSLITGSTIIESALGGFAALALVALGHDPRGAALFVSAYFAAYVLGRLSLYWLTKHIAARHLLLVSAIGTAVAAGLAAAGLAGPGFVLAGVFVGIAFPAAYVWQAGLLGPDPRMASSMVLAGLTGGTIGPVLFGTVLVLAGMQSLFAVVALLAALLALVIGRAINQHAPSFRAPAPPV